MHLTNEFVKKLKYNFIATALVLAAALIAVALISPAAGAESAAETEVNVQITGSTAPKLEVDSFTTTVSAMPIIITGLGDNLTQVQVYINGVMTEIIPLAVGNQAFNYNLNLSYGHYTVKLVGISAYTADNPEEQFQIIYQAPTEATDEAAKPSSGDKSISSSTTSNKGFVISDSPASSSDRNSAAKPQKPTKLPGWLVRVMIPLDIINPAQIDEAPRSIWRVIVLIFGLFLLVFAPVATSIYRNIRYRQLGWAKRPLPLFVQRRPNLWLRLVGGVLVVITFMFI